MTEVATSFTDLSLRISPDTPDYVVYHELTLTSKEYVSLVSLAANDDSY